MTKSKYVFRYYRFSVNLGIYSYYGNTRVYKLNRVFIPYLVGFFYAILNVLLGFWGLSLYIGIFKIRSTFEAIHYNLTGGIDMTDFEEVLEYSDRTNYVFNNLLRKTTEKITREEVEIISEIFDSFLEMKGGDYKDNIEYFVIKSLAEVDKQWVQREEVRDVLETLAQYETSYEEDMQFAL